MRSEEQTAYSLSNVALAGAGGFLLATGVVLFFFRDEYQPLREDIPTPPTVPDKEGPKPGTPPELRPGPTEDDYLVLRLLSGDERTMFRAVVDNGGEALQKDLIVRLKWSDAKVSRVIDRLIEKGVVTKERHGSTNRIRVSVDT
jgi:uncharacterized membrane protein